jgi:hypothetical protein
LSEVQSAQAIVDIIMQQNTITITAVHFFFICFFSSGLLCFIHTNSNMHAKTCLYNYQQVIQSRHRQLMSTAANAVGDSGIEPGRIDKNLPLHGLN